MVVLPTYMYEMKGGLMVCSQPAACVSIRDDIYLYNFRPDAVWAAHVLRTFLPLSHVVLTVERQFNNDMWWAIAVYEKKGNSARSYRGIVARIEHQHVLISLSQNGMTNVVPDSNSGGAKQ